MSCSVHAISEGRERSTFRVIDNFFPSQGPYIVVQQKFSSAPSLYPVLQLACLFSVFLCFYQGINLTPCKHPEPSGSPEYWSSNAGCSITPTELQKSWPYTSSVMPVCEQLPRIQGSTSNLRLSTSVLTCLVSILMFYTQNQVCGSTFDLLISLNRHRGGKHQETQPCLIMLWSHGFQHWYTVWNLKSFPNSSNLDSNLFLDRDKADTIMGSRGEAQR